MLWDCISCVWRNVPWTFEWAIHLKQLFLRLVRNSRNPIPRKIRSSKLSNFDIGYDSLRSLLYVKSFDVFVAGVSKPIPTNAKDRNSMLKRSTTRPPMALYSDYWIFQSPRSLQRLSILKIYLLQTLYQLWIVRKVSERYDLINIHGTECSC